MSVYSKFKAKQQFEARMNVNDAFASDHFWTLTNKVIYKMRNHKFRNFMAHQKEDHAACDRIMDELENDIKSI